MFSDIGVWGDRMFAALADGLWQGLVLGALLWLLRGAFRRASASTRYAVSFAFLVAVAILPLVAGQQAPSPELQTVEIEPRVSLSPSTMMLPPPLRDVPRPAPLPDKAAVTGFVWPSWLGEAVPRLAVALWLAAAAVGLLRLIVSCRALNGIKRRARPLDRELLPALDAERRACAITISPEVSAPVMLGWLRPVICLPERWTAWSRDDLEQVLLHERAHLRRWDDFTLLMQRVIEAVFFFHPAVRWMGRRLDLDREIACDDHVVAATHSPKSFAACLARLAEGAAYIRLAEEGTVEWRDRGHFFALASRTMRRVLVEHARRRAAEKRGGGAERVPLDSAVGELTQENTDLVALDAALERLNAEQPVKRQLVELRFFGGFTVEETAEALKISTGSVKRQWTSARAWLYREIESGRMDA